MSDWPKDMLVKPIVTWPGEPTKNRTHSRFGSTWTSTLTLLKRELDLVRAKVRVLQIDLDERYFRIDGFPRANAVTNGPGIIITFDAFKTTLSYPCDTYVNWQDNVRAVALSLEKLRAVDRYGVTKRGEQYQGFKALPSGSIAMDSGLSFADAAVTMVRLADMDHFDEGLLRKVRNDPEFRNAIVYRRAARRVHPDQNGGEYGLFQELSRAKAVLDRGPVAG